MSNLPKPLPKPLYWGGTLVDDCNLCHGSFNGVMVDGKTVHGPWANMCWSCWKRHGITRDNSLGQGIGQRYEHQSDGRWLKTAG